MWRDDHGPVLYYSSIPLISVHTHRTQGPRWHFREFPDQDIKSLVPFKGRIALFHRPGISKPFSHLLIRSRVKR